jgi:hypothetical protein
MNEVSNPGSVLGFLLKNIELQILVLAAVNLSCYKSSNIMKLPNRTVRFPVINLFVNLEGAKCPHSLATTKLSWEQEFFSFQRLTPESELTIRNKHKLTL